MSEAAPRRPVGRPRTPDPTTHVRASEAQLAEVDALRGEQSRQEVVAEALARWIRQARRRQERAQ